MEGRREMMEALDMMADSVTSALQSFMEMLFPRD